MTKKSGSIWVAAALLLIVEWGVYADPNFSVASPQSEVTRGKFESDSDYFISVRNYTNMDFDKFFSVASYKRQRSTDIDNSKLFYANVAQLGAATRIGKLYMGMSYIGNALLDFGSRGSGNIYSYTDQILDSPDGDERAWKVFNGFPELSYGRNMIHNEAALLFGIADMGFKLYYASNYQKNSQSDFVSTSNQGRFYKSYNEEMGHINPGIVWGMVRELIPDRGIKPEVGLDLNFFRWSIKQENYDSNTGEPGGEYVRSSQNRFIPGISISTGDFTMYRLNNFSLNAGLNYGIKMYFFFDNEYSYPDASGKYQTKKLKGGMSLSNGEADISADTFTEDESQIHNALTPNISVHWSGERIGLSGSFNVAMDFDHSTHIGKALKQGANDGSLVKGGEEMVRDIYKIVPGFDFAMQYAIVPQKLFLNVGCAVMILSVETTNTDRKVYANDVENKSLAEKRVYIESNFASTDLYLGVTFNPTANVGIQAALGVDSGNSVNIFKPGVSLPFPDKVQATGGFINFANILMTLKF